MRRLNKTYPYQKQLKNRSTKDIRWLVGPGTKPIERSMSGERLKQLANECKSAGNRWSAELNRRAKKQERKEA